MLNKLKQTNYLVALVVAFAIGIFSSNFYAAIAFFVFEIVFSLCKNEVVPKMEKNFEKNGCSPQRAKEKAAFTLLGTLFGSLAVLIFCLFNAMDILAIVVLYGVCNLLFLWAAINHSNQPGKK